MLYAAADDVFEPLSNRRSYLCTPAAVQQPQQSAEGFQTFCDDCRTFSRLIRQRSRCVRISGHRQVAPIQRVQVNQIPSAVCHTPPYHTLTPATAPSRTSTTRHCCCVEPKIQTISTQSPTHSQAPCEGVPLGRHARPDY